MEINEMIKHRRLELGLTLEQVATHVGVGKSTVRKWETGDIKNMRRDKIGLLAEILKVSPSLIMGWSEEKNNIGQKSEFSQIKKDFIEKVKSMDDEQLEMLNKIIDAVLDKREK